MYSEFHPLTSILCDLSRKRSNRFDVEEELNSKSSCNNPRYLKNWVCSFDEERSVPSLSITLSQPPPLSDVVPRRTHLHKPRLTQIYSFNYKVQFCPQGFRPLYVTRQETDGTELKKVPSSSRRPR